MLSDLVSHLIAITVVDPMQAEMQEKLKQARAPVEIVQQSQACIASQGPKLLERASNDWGWAVGTTVTVLVGATSPVDLLDASASECSALIDVLKASEGDA
ncbi:hypothetical protein RHAB21_00541 [Pseudorhizobium halotolerans]|uniref:Uncharacterized protein n=1 Tax=Pseudorhizobium halotolerans TaxID=1233081 RepID=A0ABN7K0U2_9HYPH|nr:hypothetical protein [Pseudorhizobium halotolerans]MCA0344221.1 hypothetical protein [Pseudomonadota bacterium]CAD7054414.1 hypothetical protein RHAB21_00541 [Pseudorhizobium halotolerans]